MTSDPGPRRRITPGDWLGPRAWIISVVAVIVGTAAIFATHNWLIVAVCYFAALVYLVIPPYRRRLRIRTAEIRKRRHD